MRKSVRVWSPLLVITVYYAACIGVFLAVMHEFPEFRHYLPTGGVEDLMSSRSDQLDLLKSPIVSGGADVHTIQLALSVIGAVLLMAPVSWTYFITTPTKRVDRSFAQTMIILPIIVAGIVMIVQNSVALAFSLAGIVAAVRFRFALSEAAHTLYVFCATAIGLSAGVSAIGIATVISVAFVYGTLCLWALDYGARLNSPFFAFLTSRDREEDEP